MTYPLQHLRSLLEDAKAHERPFEQAWDEAVEKLRADLPEHQRPEWTYVFCCTREAWRDAYDDEPTYPAGIDAVTLHLDID